WWHGSDPGGRRRARTTRRYWSNLPAGEVFTTPKSVDGVFVCDGTAGDYFGPKYGDLRTTPLTLEINGGRLTAAHCVRKDLEQEFWAYCHTDEHSDRVGELAFGTNIALDTSEEHTSELHSLTHPLSPLLLH